ncbi:Hsp20/alpha crystallin family protein [Streptomyces termitum]|uniref:Hsp20/alpha crystallin family protein n=1 Tax=Streptomyces termitum TaxID=67368 RepID=UPI0033BCE899
MLMRPGSFLEPDLPDRRATGVRGTWSRPVPVPVDTCRVDDAYVAVFDLPGVDPDAIDIEIERNLLTVRAERRPLAQGDEVRTELSERPLGVFARRLLLADTLDPDGITATYEAGVLTLRIPLAERAGPRRISVTRTDVPRRTGG